MRNEDRDAGFFAGPVVGYLVAAVALLVMLVA